ncbi:MAG: pyridoxal 5'-phosphate synthase glutaminase subunit PdxT [Acidimicrobiaceae bacterium]|nr:pyridoxal 5'-phosphate synthase glutaminase subunit PdxT [Acidimicrobiaceae bacterium]
MSGLHIGVLALQGDVREHCRVLAELGAAPIEVRTPADLERVDRLVLPGGESTTVSLLLDSAGLREPLGKRLREGMPAFGTCAGMILLATEVLDGREDQEPLGAIDITVRRNAFGRQVDSFETDLDLKGKGLEGGPPLHAVFIRAPLVERAGPDVEVLAATKDRSGTCRPVVCRQGAVLVAAFHPELTGDIRLHALFVDTNVPAGT